MPDIMTEPATPIDMQTITVDLQDRSYPIQIGQGLLDHAYTVIQPYFVGKKVAIITDENVAKLLLGKLTASLEGHGLTVVPIILAPGEGAKSFEYLQNILTKLLEENFSRGDTLVAFGGGVIGDLTGFAASMLKRGCRFIQIPTTLLAQVDSSVGGKTAINMPAGKNLVGAFYQPKLVVTDLDVLRTLPDRELRAGYAEVLKYGLIDDLDFYHWLEKNGNEVLAKNPQALQEAISVSCSAKAAIVKADEREHEHRALLNLGHSFAHAIEAIAGYDGRVLHGEAVSAGLLMALEFSAYLGACPFADVQSLKNHLQRVGLPTVEDLQDRVRMYPSQFFDFMMRDKKNTDARLTLILTKGIGRAYIAKNVDQSVMKTYLDKTLMKVQR